MYYDILINKRHIIERLIDIKHIVNIIVVSLKAVINDLFYRHELSIPRLHEQGYDGVSNI